jgi:hypothetical protein
MNTPRPPVKGSTKRKDRASPGSSQQPSASKKAKKSKAIFEIFQDEEQQGGTRLNPVAVQDSEDDDTAMDSSPLKQDNGKGKAKAKDKGKGKGRANSWQPPLPR